MWIIINNVVVMLKYFMIKIGIVGMFILDDFKLILKRIGEDFFF